jgi:cytosine/adenosine deaminase-related metal-dependent hydrolase
MIFTASKLLSHQRRLISDGAVVFSRGAIQAVGPARVLLRKYPNHRVHSFNNTVLLPGLINLHTHLELPELLDSVRAQSFPEWVINLIAAKKKLKPVDYRAAAGANIQTLLRTGTTTVGEICTHQASPALLKRSGLRSVLYNEIISMNPGTPCPHYSAPTSRSSSLMHYGISPHAPYTVSERVLRMLSTTARHNTRQICMHVAESKDEIKFLRGEESGFDNLYDKVGWERNWAPSADSPFEYLYRLKLLGPNFLAVHAVHTTDKDISMIRRSKTSLVHCPRSNKETRVGTMPIKKFLDAGITVGLGTDSLASSPTLNMWDEMRYAYIIHRRDGVSAEDIFRIATIGGAMALGLDKEIGTIEPGKKADLIAVPLPSKNTGDLYSDLLRETKSCIMTMVNGKILRKESP